MKQKKIKGISKKEYFKSYYEANKDKIAETKKAYYEANKDKIAETRKAYYKANKDKIKAYREANKDKIKAYYKANKDKIAEHFKNTHTNIPLFGSKGGKACIYTNGVTKEIKELLPKIVNKVLEDCII